VLLAIDIGNTNVKYGIWQGEELITRWRVATERTRMPDEWWVVLNSLASTGGIDLREIDGAILSSSVPAVTPWIVTMLRERLGSEPIVVAHGMDLGVTADVDNPAEVGPDRLVDAAAAFSSYGGPVVILDFGTATTLNVVTRDGAFIGGAIAPSIRLAHDALIGRAAKLTSVDLVIPPRVIGRNTVAGMQSGIMFGYAGLIDGLIARIDAELGAQPFVVATGGLGEIYVDLCPRVTEYRPDLTLEGLRVIWERLQRSTGGST
jgi:type III pantothenate kinase